MAVAVMARASGQGSSPHERGAPHGAEESARGAGIIPA